MNDSMPAEEVHATCIALDGIGVLLRGAAGAGKSDLALRMIGEGAKLVADDRVRLAREGETVIASAPPPLAGMIEVRGLGIVRLNADGLKDAASVCLVCDLVPENDIERLPEPARITLLGIGLPFYRLDPFAASATHKLRLAAGFGPGSIMVGA